ncbi:sensor histidine kinase [Sporosarcina sp. BI001-red]|uniref:sensor histidine kinase n=1 Tax=Sporosarcina sp. BI001-red TaxID=2282866 RepID=UPI000E24BDE7|nr:sensor histidine kinase [Sporosarcina sp. BI001-red]REB08667.1 sensor histidine kinase [Sporosarcina sp. BI001-red]
MKTFELFPRRFGWIPYVFLAYLTFPLFHVLSETGLKRILGFVLLAVFVIAYREAYRAVTDAGLIGWSTILMVFIIVLAWFYQPYNLILAFYVSNFIGGIGDARLFKRAIEVFGSGLVLCGVLLVSEYGMETGIGFFPFIIVMALTPIAVRNSAERGRLEEKLDAANEQIRELSRQEERVRIARDLHDTLGHTLSLITLKSQVVQRVRNDSDRVLEEAKGIENTSRSALKQVRELVSDMRGSSVAEELVQMQEILSAASIELKTDFPDPLPDLPPLKQTIIGMCIRELATNIVRHSNASTCLISIRETDDGLVTRVKDNGIGMTGAHYGNGLNGIVERLALVEGTLSIKEQSGTLFKLVVPLPITTRGGETG